MAHNPGFDKHNAFSHRRSSDAVQEWMRALEAYKNIQIEQTKSLEKLLCLLGPEANEAQGPSGDTSADGEAVKQTILKRHVDKNFQYEATFILLENRIPEDNRLKVAHGLTLPRSIHARLVLADEAPWKIMWECLSHQQGRTTYEEWSKLPLKADHSWRYHATIVPLEDDRYAQSVLIVDNGPRTTPKYVKSFADFVPSWELLQHREGENIFYHVDDVSHLHPIKIVQEELEAHQSDWTEIPYSFAPPVHYDGFRYSKTPLPWIKVTEALGDLPAIPPDGRLFLSFDRSRLRQLRHDGLLDDFLDHASTILGETGSRINAAYHLLIWDSTSIGWSNPYAPFSFPIHLPYPGQREGRFDQVPPYAQGNLLARSNESIDPFPPVPTPAYDIMSSRCPDADDMPRPWCRVICFSNAAHVFTRSQSWKQRKISRRVVDDMISTFFVLANKKKAGFPHPCRLPNGFLHPTFFWHLTCFQHRPLANDMSLSWRPLHFTWHCLSVGPNPKFPPSIWPTGEFYLNRKCEIQKQAFTLLYIPGGPIERSRSASPTDFQHVEETELLSLGYIYWTLLVLCPRLNYHLIPLGISSIPHFGPQVLQSPLVGLNEAAKDLDILADDFDRHFRAGDQVLDPDQHDKLLVDDDDFSRSKKYFWALSFLETLMRQIQDIKDEMKVYAETRCPVYKKLYLLVLSDAHKETNTDPKVGEKRWNHCMREIEEKLEELEMVKTRFEVSHERITALRDGLFNASSVHESRASTRLAQNVKLLTYVSIFYLPLSFCVALWSINENYPRSPLILTTVLVGSATYFIVGNMHSIDTLRRRFVYDFVGKGLLGRMPTEWGEKAKSIRGFKTDEGRGGTSKWAILKFGVVFGGRWIMSLFKGLRGLLRKRGPGESKVETTEVDTEGQGPA